MKDISSIIARCLLKIAKKEEKDTLSEWTSISEGNESFAEQMERFWGLSIEEKPYVRLDMVRKRFFARLNTIRESDQRKSLVPFFTRIAAAIVFIVSIAGISIYIASETGFLYQNNWVVVSTEAGQQSSVTLPDGTSVWLNAETEVKYYAGKDIRKVNLTGEAYFEVTHASDFPFVVETGNTEIKVLGTKFNASHYPGSEMTEATLLTGKITMSLPGHSREVELQPGQKLIYHAGSQAFSKATVKVQNAISWRQGILIFENESFNSLVEKLERYYAVEFIYDKNIFENIHYTGTLDNLSIHKVLEFINLTIPIKYEIENKTIKLNFPKKKK